MSEQYERLKVLLLELFQLDKPDLDFGIYRIMHARAAEVTKFLDEDLLPQVKDALAGYEAGNREQIQAELDAMTAGLEAAGVDPASSPKVTELNAALRAAGDVHAVEGEVYDLITRFFKRYYSEGDFISQRRYSSHSTYSIPYDGEEVLLHWANKDQYYIKTSEYLNSYSFLLHPDSSDQPMRVRFRLVDADEGEHGNVKSGEGKARIFVLAPAGASGHGFAHLVDGELLIDFEFRPTTMADWPAGSTGRKPPTQKDMTAAASREIARLEGDIWKPWLDGLQAKYLRLDGNTSERTKLEVHLDRYAKKNTFDYFIHKDLGRFLQNELDFFIKNEVMHLDDVENAEVAKVENYLGKIRAVRRVAGKIIDFLAQLEDFQKRLWLKKKFVVSTSYLITVGSIDEHFYAEICANEAQRKEWVELFKIDRQKGDLFDVKYSEPLDPRFLTVNPTMTLDTALFSPGFTDALLESLSTEGLDEAIGGTLVHSENFQAVALLQTQGHHEFDAIYIDPPYNTDASSIMYKNDYRDSSWMSMMANRLELGGTLLAEHGLLCVAIDDAEQSRLQLLLDLYYGRDATIGVVPVRSNPSGRSTPTGVSSAHEYALFAAASEAAEVGRLGRTPEQIARYKESDDISFFEWVNFRKHGGAEARRSARRRMYYPIYARGEAVRLPQMSYDETDELWVIHEQPGDGEVVVWPNSPDGHELRWKWGVETLERSLSHFRCGPDRYGAPGIYMKSRLNDEGMRPVSWWGDKKYSATEYGTNLLKDVLGTNASFTFPKAVDLVADCIRVCTSRKNASILDFFAGSGTTGHAVIKMNREDGGRRRFTLVEAGQHFASVLVPRQRRILFAPSWTNGEPAARASRDDFVRGPAVMKVLSLESYEDTLNNLVLSRSDDQQNLLDSAGGDFREQYTLQYQLNVESEGSGSLLTTAAFDHPTNYELMIKRPGSDESRPTTVDLIETFNYLIGLTVDGITAPRSFACETSHDARGRLQVVPGSFKQSADGGHWFRAVTGTNPDGDRVLIIWRNRPGRDEVDPRAGSSIEIDNTVLNHWFGDKQKYSVRDSEFDLIYVNGDNNLENLRRPDEQWKVRRIDDEFHRLMFDTSGMP